MRTLIRMALLALTIAVVCDRAHDWHSAALRASMTTDICQVR